jgi:hypothetical protein
MVAGCLPPLRERHGRRSACCFAVEIDCSMWIHYVSGLAQCHLRCLWLYMLARSYQSDSLPELEMRAQYACTASALLQHVDMFLAETLSTPGEAIAAAAATAGLGG